MKAKNVPCSSEMENKYEWTSHINLHFNGFVIKAQTLSHSAFPAPLICGWPSHPRGFSCRPSSASRSCHLYLSSPNHISLYMQVSEERWKCQGLGTFLRNGFQPQAGIEFPWHINICSCIKSKVFIHAQEDGLVQEATWIQKSLVKAYASHMT